MTQRKDRCSIKKPKLIELLTDIVAASNTAVLSDAIERARDELSNAALWNNKALPIVDSDTDVYGYANSPHYAKMIADESYQGIVSHVKQVGPIKLRDGTKHAAAYMIVGTPVAEAHAYAA